MAAITSFGNLSVKLQSNAFIVSHGRPASLAVRAEAADGERKKTGAELREEFFLAAATGKERGLPEGAFLNDNVVDGPMVDITWEPYGDTCSAPVSAYNATYFSFRRLSLLSTLAASLKLPASSLAMAGIPCQVTSALAGARLAFHYDVRPASAISNPVSSLVRISPFWGEAIGGVHAKSGCVGSRERFFQHASTRESGVCVRAFGKEGASDIDGTVASVSDNRRQIREILASSASPDADVSAGMGVGGCDFLQSGCESDCPICASAGAGGRSSDVESPPCLIGLTTAAQFARKDATLLARCLFHSIAALSSSLTPPSAIARAREDAGVLDARARLRVRRLRHLALVRQMEGTGAGDEVHQGLEESAREELSRQAAQHWRDGALA
ncbi:unnamed protein product, partial [Closterium sp. NIES-64]